MEADQRTSLSNAEHVVNNTDHLGEGKECPCFSVGKGTKGRGVFAAENIPPRTVLHVAPCVSISREEYEKHMRFTVLEHYLFNDKATGGKLLALGYGSLFNHSQHPNVDYRVVVRDSHGGRCIVYSSGHQPIEKGEELCIYYGSNLWFDDADGPDSSSCSDDEPATEKGLPSFLGRMKTHDGDADSING